MGSADAPGRLVELFRLGHELRDLDGSASSQRKRDDEQGVKEPAKHRRLIASDRRLPAMISRRLMRAAVDGCVANRPARPPPENGLTMNRCAVAGEPALRGTCRPIVSSLRSASASASGFPDNLAPVASARNSRDREIAS